MTNFLGLTGSIGMGKTATAEMFASSGVPVYDADAEVHALYYQGGGGVGPIREAFPEVIVNNAVSRPLLREIVLNDADALKKLNAIIHPLVGQAQITFRKRVISSGAPFGVLDIPLLFETGGDKACDYVAVVTAPADIQRNRVLARNTMSEAEFETILAKQVPDKDKRAKADFIISTAFGFKYAQDQVDAIIDLMKDLAKKDDDNG